MNNAKLCDFGSTTGASEPEYQARQVDRAKYAIVLSGERDEVVGWGYDVCKDMHLVFFDRAHLGDIAFEHPTLGFSALSALFSKGVLDCHPIDNESQKIAAGCSYFLAVSVGSDKVPFERPNVAGCNHFQIFEFAVGIAIEESLYTTTDAVLANIAFTKCVGSHRRMVDAVLGVEAGDQIGVRTVPRGSKFFGPLARHFCAHSSLIAVRLAVEGEG
jgi:hypothetical protein